MNTSDDETKSESSDVSSVYDDEEYIGMENKSFIF